MPFNLSLKLKKEAHACTYSVVSLQKIQATIYYC